jgi:hypothetical protein
MLVQLKPNLIGATEEMIKCHSSKSIKLTQVPRPAGSSTHDGETSDPKAVRFTAVVIPVSFRVCTLLSWALSLGEPHSKCETE